MKAKFIDFPIAEMPIGGTSFSVKGLREQLLIKNRVGKIPLIFCCFIFCIQLLLFYTYSIRHSGKL